MEMIQNKWPILANSPIEVALFQIKYDIGGGDLSDFLTCDTEIRKSLPIRKDDFSANINLEHTRIPLGESKITGISNTKLSQYTYLSQDQKSKLAITSDTITYVEEHKYDSWETYLSTINDYLQILSPILTNQLIKRTSIRFINRFKLDQVTNLLDYFKTTISTQTDDTLPFSVSKYGFKIYANIDENRYSVINQSLDKPSNMYEYVFDIDVLDKSQVVFDLHTINELLSNLRECKNIIFFGNLTDKGLELCN